jgi:hypothetical protein
MESSGRNVRIFCTKTVPCSNDGSLPEIRTGNRAAANPVEIVAMTRTHTLVIALCCLLSAVAELALLGDRTTARAHEIATVEGNGGLAPVELPVAPLRLVRIIPVTSGQETLGAIAIYDNPMTRRPEDYLELRDNDGHIVAVEWFDRFGIRRLTLDRGFLSDAGKFENIFVTVVSGESI